MADLPIIPSDLSTLDRGLLEALVIAQQKQMIAKDEAIAAHHEKLISRDNEIEHLKLVIAKLRRMIFGTKSEKVTREIEQLELKLEELETGKAERVSAADKADAQPRNKPTRRPLPAHLSREVHTHLPTEEACPDRGGELRKLGEDVSEILERILPSYNVIQHVRLKMACAKCDVIVQAPAPSRPIERGLAGPAHVLVSKYADHCPLYRQSEIFARDGIDLDRSTLADWVGSASHLLSPLIDQIRKHVMEGSIYVNLEDKNVVAVVDLNVRQVIARWLVAPGGQPVGMSIDPKQHRLFIGCRKPQQLVVMNTESGKVEGSLPIGAGVDATAFYDGRAFASCRDGSLTVAHFKNGSLESDQPVKTPEGARTLALDRTSHRIYLPTAEFEPATTGHPNAKPGTFMIVVVERQ